MHLKCSEQELVTGIWTIGFMLYVAQKAASGDEEVVHMLEVLADMAHKRVLETILESAGLPADLGPSAIGR